MGGSPSSWDTSLSSDRAAKRGGRWHHPSPATARRLHQRRAGNRRPPRSGLVAPDEQARLHRLDASSALRISDLQVESDIPTVNNLHFTFHAQANKTYSLFQAGGLDNNNPDTWHKFLDVPAAPTNRVLRLFFQSAIQQTFIRVTTP